VRPKSPIDISLGQARERLLFAAVELGLADALSNVPQSVEQLAAKVDAIPFHLRRLLRALTTIGIVEEVSGGFTISSKAAILKSDHPQSIRNIVLYFGAEWTVNAWSSLSWAVRTGKSGFEFYYGKPFFEYLSENPAAQELFNMALTGTGEMIDRAVLMSYDFSWAKVVTDLGGGTNKFTQLLLERYIDMEGVVFDTATKPLPHHERQTQTIGSFFGPLPPSDIYILKNVLHDWDDVDATRILTNCAAAMRGRSRLLIIESLLGTDDYSRLMDIGMLAVTGGMERTLDEYVRLIKPVGLDLFRVIPTGSTHTILEVGLGASA